VLGRRAVMRVPGVADSTGYDSSITLPDSFHQLSRIMQFPEEVAFQLTDVEHRLFSRVPAVDYIRLVTSDLTKQPLVLPTSSTTAAKAWPTVADLILRFQQVCIKSNQTKVCSHSTKTYTSTGIGVSEMYYRNVGNLLCKTLRRENYHRRYPPWIKPSS